ncbi:hypothetical protein Tco_0325002 [Tanacetum coccineum]
MKRVNTFVDMKTELVKSIETRTEGNEHVEVGKDDDQEEAEMKKHIEIVKDNEVAIDAIPLATKPPVIVKYKIVKEGKFVYFQLLSVDGSSKRYLSMIKMLQNIDREDLETLWKLVKAKHGNTRPEDEYERVLWGDTKIQKMNVKFRGGLLGLKDFKMILRVTTAQLQLLMFTQCFNIVALELSKGANSLQAEEQDIPPPTITAMKIPIIRKGEYDIWSMRMRQYICHTDHNLWDVIVNGDLEEEPAPTTGETSAPPAPKTAKQLAARRNQERVKSILLLAIPDEYLLKFHNVTDAKSLGVRLFDRPKSTGYRQWIKFLEVLRISG